MRELRGDNHWALCAAPADGDAVSRGWTRLEAKGLATDSALNDAGRQFRLDLEQRTNELTAPAWQAVGETTTLAFCDAVEPHHDTFVGRIDATAGPRWMPATRQQAAKATG